MEGRKKFFWGLWFLFRKVFSFIIILLLNYFVIMSISSVYEPSESILKNPNEYWECVKLIQNEFLTQNSFPIENNTKFHFQNLFIFYIPFCISWFTTLLMNGFGPIFKGITSSEIKRYMKAKVKEVEKKKCS